MSGKTLAELAEYVEGQVRGDANTVIKSASTLNRAGEGDISFLANIKYEKHLATTKAAAVIVSKDTVTSTSVPLLICEDPYYAFMQIMVLLHGHRKHKKVGISPKAEISDTAKVGTDCHIHQYVTIDDNAKIGNGFCDDGPTGMVLTCPEFNYDGGDCGSAPEITSPTPGSTLSGSSETFYWTAG